MNYKNALFHQYPTIIPNQTLSFEDQMNDIYLALSKMTMLEFVQKGSFLDKMTYIDFFHIKSIFLSNSTIKIPLKISIVNQKIHLQSNDLDLFKMNSANIEILYKENFTSRRMSSQIFL